MCSSDLLVLSVFMLWAILSLIEVFGEDASLLPLVYVLAFYFIKQDISAAKLMTGALLPSTLAPPFAVMFLCYLDRKSVV